MSENRIEVDAPPERVFDVLADPERYREWVVGAAETDRTAGSRAWPRPGSWFAHRVGVGPFSVRDTTEVTASERPRRVVLEARFRPLGVAEIELALDPIDGGSTRVTMRERPLDGPIRFVPRRLLDAMFHARNVESLRRLKSVVES